MRKELLVFGSPEILSTEIEEVVSVLKSGWLGTGPKVTQFEQDFSEYKGVENSVAKLLHCSFASEHIGCRRRAR